MRTSGNSHTRHADPLDLLRRDIAAIKHDLSVLVNRRLSAASDRTRELLDESKHRAMTVHKQLAKAVSQRPITTIAVASVVGMVGAKILGFMLRR